MRVSVWVLVWMFWKVYGVRGRGTGCDPVMGILLFVLRGVMFVIRWLMALLTFAVRRGMRRLRLMIGLRLVMMLI